jgi:hypothetical protein
VSPGANFCHLGAAACNFLRLELCWAWGSCTWGRLSTVECEGGLTKKVVKQVQRHCRHKESSVVFLELCIRTTRLLRSCLRPLNQPIITPRCPGQQHKAWRSEPASLPGQCPNPGRILQQLTPLHKRHRLHWLLHRPCPSRGWLQSCHHRQSLQFF